MNKKDILEIRKQFTPERCCIDRICGCYVDHEKTKKFVSMAAFLSLPEEEEFKYFTLFKQTLSGTPGKNLVYMDFPTDAEMPGGTQDFLMKLRASKLDDDMLVEEFYDRMIESFHYGENYYIILIHGTYDIPGKSSDGLEMYDASDNVYDHILCSICPVNMSKAGLAYNEVENVIENRIRDWVVDAPMRGFLFPAFVDRSADIHQVIAYAKNPEDEQPDYLEKILGASIPMTPKTQKSTFNIILAETLGDEGDYEAICNIHEQINELIEEQKDNPEPLVLSKPDVRRILSMSGVDEEKLDHFEQVYDEEAGERTELLASNIAVTKKFEIETPDIIIKVSPDRADLIETRVIDGRQCLVIAVDDHIQVNGINVRTIAQKTETSEE